ncbi:MAG: cytochrome C55X precursor NirC [Gammaproteobacteria bacterium RBG_16_57_12]|nr:MAG: cytochrome C55X precursor NirC [Gammaproteobacteria bacterium RBG_16_57_12]
MALIFALFAHPVGAQESSLTPARQKELIYLLRQDCGSCHGLTLEGGLGPTLLPKDLADKSEEWLREVILNGIPETAMPPWRSLLAEPEVDWLVKMMKRGVPDAK